MMSSHKVAFKCLSVAVILIEASSVNAGLDTDKGNYPEFWSNHSVVYATVLEVSPAGKGWILKLSVEATLSGAFDAALNPTPSVKIRRVGIASSVIRLPTAHSHIVIVLENEGGSYVVPSSLCGFMPYRFPICEVADCSDKKVVDIRSTLIALRSEIKKLIERGPSNVDSQKNVK